jgi:acyl-homoserine lactone acylase PvdQ
MNENERGRVDGQAQAKQARENAPPDTVEYLKGYAAGFNDEINREEEDKE